MENFKKQRYINFLCPKCGEFPKEYYTKYGVRNRCCDLWSWGYMTPLVDRETHEMRKEAHRVFDQLWKIHGMDRSAVYKVLGDKLGIDQFHIKSADKETCRKIPRLSLEILTEWRNGVYDSLERNHDNDD